MYSLKMCWLPRQTDVWLVIESPIGLILGDLASFRGLGHGSHRELHLAAILNVRPLWKGLDYNCVKARATYY